MCVTNLLSTISIVTKRKWHSKIILLLHRVDGTKAMQRDHLDRALSIWGDQAWYKNQFSRSSFLKGKHLMSLGGDDIKEGKKWVQRALQIRREIVPNDQKSEDELDIGDFDELVVFWSR
jgi:hypothetical protein